MGKARINMIIQVNHKSQRREYFDEPDSAQVYMILLLPMTPIITQRSLKLHASDHRMAEVKLPTNGLHSVSVPFSNDHKKNSRACKRMRLCSPGAKGLCTFAQEIAVGVLHSEIYSEVSPPLSVFFVVSID